MSNQLLPQWQTSSLDENVDNQSQQDLKGSQQINKKGSDSDTPLQVNPSQELNYLPLQQKQPFDEYCQPQAEVPSIAAQISEKNPVQIQEPGRMHISEGESQFLKMQKFGNQQAMLTGMNNQQAVATDMSNQQAMATVMSNQQVMAAGISNQQAVATRMSNQQSVASGIGNQQAMAADMGNQQSTPAGQAINAMNRGKQVPFAMLLPVIQSQLDKDRAMQLQTLYYKLKNNEISKDGFIRHMRSIVGDQMLKMAVYKLQAQGGQTSQTGPSQFQSQSQSSSQCLEMPPTASKQLSAFPSHVSSSTVQVSTVSTRPTMDSNVQMARDIETQPDIRGMQVSQTSSTSLNTLNQEWESSSFPIQGLSKQQQQHLHFSQGSFPTYGSAGGHYQPYSASLNASAASLKQQSHDVQTRLVPVHQSMGTVQAGTMVQANNSMMSVPKLERQNSFNEPKKMQGGSLNHLAHSPALQQTSSHWQSSTNKEQKNGPPSSVGFLKQEPVDHSNDQQKRPHFYTSHGQSSFSSPQIEEGNAIPGTLKDESSDMQPSRMNFSTPSTLVSNSVSSSILNPMDPIIPVGSRIPSATTPMPSASNMKTPPKKPSIGQKKPLEALGSPPLPSKKQKVAGAFSDQSIEQLNDVTAVSGVNLREEEEQLLSGTREDGRVSETSRRVVQEEEERLILQKFPLQKKIAEIMTKCGIKSVGHDVERCLSLAVEERMRGLISNLIRLSKQRVDIEKTRHRTIITSDVRQQIMKMNQKAREEWEKKQAEAEKLQKVNEPEGSTGVDGDKEKDEGRVKSFKANKEEDDKMRATAANVAARVAVGGDDMLSKWQLMAEQARQKREGVDVASGSQVGKDVGRQPLSTSIQNARDNQEGEKRSHSTVATPGSIRKFGRNQFVPQHRVARSVSVKDVIAFLEREPQMSKSTLIYRLYEKSRTDAVHDSS